MIDTNAQTQLYRDAQQCSQEDEERRRISVRTKIDDALSHVHTCCPGIVESFDASAMTVKVQPAVKRLFYPDGINGEWHNLPVLVDVPICVVSGGGYALTFPIASGDECLLLFAERPTDIWHEQGEISEQSVKTKFSLSNAFALVGVRSKPKTISNYNAHDVELRSADAQTRIRLGAQGVFVDTQGELTLTAATVKINGDVHVTGDVTSGSISLQHHLHTGVQTGGGTSGPPK